MNFCQQSNYGRNHQDNKGNQKDIEASQLTPTIVTFPVIANFQSNFDYFAQFIHQNNFNVLTY